MSGSANIRTAVFLLVRLQELEYAGRDESPEADAMRDLIEEPLRSLSEAERNWMGNLSEALRKLNVDREGGDDE